MTCDELKSILEKQNGVESLLPNTFFSRFLMPYLREKFSQVQLIHVKLEDIMERCRKIAEAKRSEKHYEIDGKRIDTRFLCGQAAELACEKKMKVPVGTIYDGRIGLSSDFNHPDLQKLGMEMGCKAAQIHNVPLIELSCTYPNVVCLLELFENNPNPFAIVAVLGVALPEIFKKFNSPLLIREAKNPSKSGFYGLDYLLPVPVFDGTRKSP